MKAVWHQKGTLFLATDLAILAAVLGCDRKDPASADSDKPNVLLVTFDTTRADYLSCYGHPGNTTPTVDAIAREGVRFANCYTPAPITLPSHASIMTGLYPHQHKLRNNGGGVLDPKAVTLAEVFRSAGYRTGAFIGAYVLHSRYGLNQGFDVYSDNFHGRGARMEDGAEFAERRASEVNDAALAWLNQKDDRPFFAWVHYFDPHAPYEAPGRPVGDDTPEDYAAEIAYTDTQLARLVDQVQQLSRQTNRQVWHIITADHGESLGDHGELTHGILLFNSTVRVPLVVKGPGVQPGASQVPVSLVDIFPSILTWLKLPFPHSLDGRELPVLASSPVESLPRPLFVETIIPFHQYGWSPLEGVLLAGHKYIHGSKDYLFDMVSDPTEARDMAATQKDRITECRNLLETKRGMPPGVPQLSAGTPEADRVSVRMLETLGYVSGQKEAPESASDLPDPMAMVPLATALSKAEKSILANQEGGAELLQEVLNHDPHNIRALTFAVSVLRRPGSGRSLIPVIRERIGSSLHPPFDVEIPSALGAALCSQSQFEDGLMAIAEAERIDPKAVKVLAAKSRCLELSGRPDEAMSLWLDRLKAEPNFSPAYEALGDMAVRRREHARAVEYYEKAASLDTKNSQVYANLANALLSLNRVDEAVQAMQRALQWTPQLAQLRNKLASILLSQGKLGEAIEQYRFLVTAAPDSATAHYDLGVALSRANQPGPAAVEFREALRLEPEHPDAMINLGITLLQLNQEAEGREFLQRASRIDAVAGAAHYNLAVADRQSGRSAQARAHLEKAAASLPPYVPAIEELSAGYMREKKYADARRVLSTAIQKVPEQAPEYLKFLNSLALLLAACPDDSVRNGPEALRLSTLASEKTSHNQPVILSSLASAQAETGDFVAATETANRALGLIGAQEVPIRSILLRQLEDFRAARPYRIK